MNKNSYEWHEINDYKSCPACHKKMIMHAYRKPNKGKPEVVRFHCENKTCQLYMVETPKNEKDEVK